MTGIHPGDFIVLEGMDGSGTTTQAKLLMAHFESQDIEATFTFHPSERPIGKMIRKLLRHEIKIESWHAQALLFIADRIEHLERTIIPALARGVTVVCDRYDLSNYVYQLAASNDSARAGRVEWLRELNQLSMRPDLTLVLDVDPDVAERRRHGRATDDELFDVPSLQRRVAHYYAMAEKFVPGDYLVHINAEDSVQKVSSRIAEEYGHYVRLKTIRALGSAT